MKQTLKIIVVLTFVCIICAFLLSFVYEGAKEKIAINAQKRIEKAITNLAPEVKTFEKMEIEPETVYELFNIENSLIGYAFLAQGQGYQGKIKLLVVIDPFLNSLEGIEVVESLETPGLGAKIAEADFANQFKELKVSGLIESVKESPTKDNQIEAITGATVSSRAVVNILNKRIRELKEQLSE